MKKSAFTLIELLVVVSIIAILAGIALPVFSKAMERGKVTMDLANMRQVGQATIAYLSDNNDQMPPTPDGTTWVLSTTGSDGFFRYAGFNTKVFQSPFDKRSQSSGSTTMPVSFTFNANVLTPQSTSTPGAWNGNYSQTVASSNTMMVSTIYKGDPTDPNAWTETGYTIKVLKAGAPDQTKGSWLNGRQVDVVYMDGHAGLVPFLNFQKVGTAATGLTTAQFWDPLAVTQ